MSRAFLVESARRDLNLRSVVPHSVLVDMFVNGDRTDSIQQLADHHRKSDWTGLEEVYRTYSLKLGPCSADRIRDLMCEIDCTACRERPAPAITKRAHFNGRTHRRKVCGRAERERCVVHHRDEDGKPFASRIDPACANSEPAGLAWFGQRPSTAPSIRSYLLPDHTHSRNSRKGSAECEGGSQRRMPVHDDRTSRRRPADFAMNTPESG